MRAISMRSPNCLCGEKQQGFRTSSIHHTDGGGNAGLSASRYIILVWAAQAKHESETTRMLCAGCGLWQLLPGGLISFDYPAGVESLCPAARDGSAADAANPDRARRNSDRSGEA